MSPRKLYTFYIDSELATGLKALKKETGAPESETIRRAVAEYLAKAGIVTKTERKRAVTRKRP